jgi:hypothetical protein
VESRPKPLSHREQAAALIIILAFVVLLSGLVLAYLSRTTTDRQVSHGSFNQTKADQLAASAMDNIIGDLRQEIINGSTATTVNGVTIYSPTSSANMLPLSNPTPTPGTTPAIPNLIRRSVRSDPISPPALVSRASAVNSTTDVSANARSISLRRWNSHYLIPKSNTGNDTSDPITTGFTGPNYWAPDWVFVTNQGGAVIASPSSSVFGRYAYAIYDEGGLLDMNVAGYPNGTTPDQSGRKGPVAFAELKELPFPITNSSSPYQIDRIVGWRNYGVTQPTNNFPDSTAFAANFRAGSAPALAYWKSVINNTSGFLTTSTAVAANGRTDQMFLSRQELLAFRITTQFSANALQYLGTFLRELNAPTWKPLTPAASTIDYATLANTPTADTSTAINRDLLAVRVSGAFTRFDGTSADVGDVLLKRRFPLSRLAWITYKGPSATLQIGKDVDPSLSSPTTSDPVIIQLVANGVNLTTIRAGTAANIKTCFGLTFPPGGVAGDPWTYTSPTGAVAATRILRLDEVAAANREPDFFELLKAAMLSGSVGMGSGSANSFVAAEQKYYITGTTPANSLSSDYQIMQIGANIIDQSDPDNVPTFVDFFDSTGNYRLTGIENLPYLNKLVFKPCWIKVAGKDQFAAWLLPSLWNPHQNAPSAAQNLRVAFTTGTMTAFITYTGGATPYASTAVTGSATQFMTVDASLFGIVGNPSLNNPSAPTAVVGTPPSSITKSPDNYYGFNFPFATNAAVTPSNSLTAYPDFGALGCDFELQVQVGTTWKTYQKWKGSGPGHPLVCQSPQPGWTATTLQDPEFVTLDPRTLRFGVWGNAGSQSAVPADYTDGTQGTLDWPAPRFELITALPPQGSNFTSPTSTNLYFYAKNDAATVRYTDLDTVQRRGDIIAGTTTAMLPTGFVDRPQILNRPFQSVAELGQVFRDQPWKTLDFTTAASADAGLLDLFTIHEANMEAGKTSLNTRNKATLTAILSQATKRLTDPTGATVITTAQRDAIVNALFTLTSNQPMIRKTDLLTQLAADPSVTGLGNKEARELVMRAFSDACQTRTWNLMIDVIAESGKYAPGETDLKRFIVEGDQRYWVHVAIDRFTGQVIDKQIEVVKE